MIIFEFKFNKRDLAVISAKDITSVPYSNFLHTHLRLPVRLNINGVELFRFDNPSPHDYWCHMAILGFAAALLQDIRALPEIGNTVHQLIQGTAFHFQMIPQNKVSIKFGEKIHLIVDYEELLAAFEHFAANTRIFLNEHVPQLNQHRFWGRWLRGEYI